LEPLDDVDEEDGGIGGPPSDILEMDDKDQEPDMDW
jgi:hypothetical protein